MHDGVEAVQKVIDEWSKGKFSASETLSPCGFSEYDSDQKQIDAIVNDYKNAIQGEKDNYEATYINHTRKKLPILVVRWATMSVWSIGKAVMFSEQLTRLK